MTRRRAHVPQRALYFVGCEGLGERAYAALINKIARSKDLHLSVQGELLNPGAGDPLALVNRAVERLAHKRKHRTSYKHAAIFLDSDRANDTPNRTNQAIRTAEEHAIQLVWQKPNLEAVLLRHLAGCQLLQPIAERSLIELQRRWPEYNKSGLSADKLGRKIGYDQIVQAAQVEDDLREFLMCIGLI